MKVTDQLRVLANVPAGKADGIHWPGGWRGGRRTGFLAPGGIRTSNPVLSSLYTSHCIDYSISLTKHIQHYSCEECRLNMPPILRFFLFSRHSVCRSQWPRGLRRRPTTVRLLGSWVRIPPGAWTFVCCECCVLLSGRGLCDELAPRPGKSYGLWCVVVCKF